MAIKARQSGDARKPVPAGKYFGVVVGVYDLGTQEGGQFGPKHQVLLTWELHGKSKGKAVLKTTDDGKPLLISKFYNLAFSEKADLRKDIEAMTGRRFTQEEAKEGFDVDTLLDVGCRLTVAHEPRKDGTGINDVISALDTLDDDDPQLEPQTEGIVYELDPGGAFPEGMPEWVRNKVMKCQEWPKGGRQSAGRPNGKPVAAAAAGGDDETPF